MPETPKLDGRAGNILKNSTTGLINNVLPSILRFFTRYVFILYFGDTLLGVNSLFADVVTIFSFAEIGIYSAISFFLYKPIAEKDTEIESLKARVTDLSAKVTTLEDQIAKAKGTPTETQAKDDPAIEKTSQITNEQANDKNAQSLRS